MAKLSAGLLMYRINSKGRPECFLVHMGGPFWAKKDKGAWTIPKGEYDPDEDPFESAKREFKEETGFNAEGEFVELTPVKQSGGKEVRAWAFKGDADPDDIESNTFEMEWPPRSGKKQAFPEIDKASWFSPEEAKEKIIKAQQGLIDELEKKLSKT
jgi:predicted NUDIX family NTP pyrophosphohydrolase